MHEWLVDVVSWAWDRHHNVLSWYIRPLFLLPFCYFAYKRSGKGIAVTLVALVTSMAWFPAPEHPSAGVVRMLEVERDYLLGDWTVWKIAIALLIPLVFGGLALALWWRSFTAALVVVNGAVLFKIAWTYYFEGGAGADAHTPTALLGLAVVDLVLVLAARRHRRRSDVQRAERAPAPAEVS